MAEKITKDNLEILRSAILALEDAYKKYKNCDLAYKFVKTILDIFELNVYCLEESEKCYLIILDSACFSYRKEISKSDYEIISEAIKVWRGV